MLIRVHACGVNPVETYIRAGTYIRKPTLPYTPGGDVAGTVETVGEGVTSVKVCVHDTRHCKTRLNKQWMNKLLSSELAFINATVGNLFIHYSNSIVQNKVENSIN